MDEKDLQASIEKIKSKYGDSEEGIAQLRKLVSTAIRENYEEVVRNLCEKAKDDKFRGYRAHLVIQSLGRESAPPAQWEYRTIQEHAEAAFKVDNWWFRLEQENEDIEKAIRRFYESVSDKFSLEINSIVWDSRDGLPLYYKVRDEFVRADENNEDYQFVRLMIKNDAIRSDYDSPPNWTKSLYVKRSDIEAFWLFHGDNSSDFARSARTAALQAYLAGKLNVETQEAVDRTTTRPLKAVTHETKLLRVLEKTRERYYGKNFDPFDINTLPKQIDVVAWLMATYKLSKREAESIDIVTRPDSARKR